VRAVIADDSVLLREGIARLLSSEGVEVAGQAGDADDLLRKVGAHRPDIAIVDIRMPPRGEDDGVVAALTIRERHPGTGVLVLSQYVTEAYAMRLLEGGTDGVGYLLKDRVSDVDTFVQAVRRVARSSTRTSCASSCPAGGPTTRSTRCPRASATSSPSWPRAARTAASRRRCSSPTRRSSAT